MTTETQPYVFRRPEENVIVPTVQSPSTKHNLRAYCMQLMERIYIGRGRLLNYDVQTPALIKSIATAIVHAEGIDPKLADMIASLMRDDLISVTVTISTGVVPMDQR